MTASIRILDTGLKPARWNVAMTAALAERHRAGAAGDTLRFHRYVPCVLVGRSQDVTEAADVTYCRAQDIEIARRVTGGGAVYISPRMLAWEVIVDRAELGGDLAGLTRLICSGVASGLTRHGAAAVFRAPTDICVNGLKVSGAAGYMDGRSAILQGTVLIEDDTPAMARALRIPEGALRGRVTSLAKALAEPPALRDVCASIVSELSKALHRAPVRDQPSRAELALANHLLDEEIGREEFVMGGDSPLQAKGAA